MQRARLLRRLDGGRGWCAGAELARPHTSLDRTITLVELDRDEPRVFYLAKVYGSTGAYWEETRAAVANHGAKVVRAMSWMGSLNN